MTPLITRWTRRRSKKITTGGGGTTAPYPSMGTPSLRNSMLRANAFYSNYLKTGDIIGLFMTKRR